MAALVQLQTNNKTFLGRHWHEHVVLRRLVTTDAGLKLLSFGCSTGEELVSLRALFPNAQLFGCDVDWYSLQRAVALLGSTAVVFVSDDAEIRRHGPYDIILCNSVLLAPTTTVDGVCRGIDPRLWADVVGLLDGCLNPGGIIQVINSNIPFRYHPCSSEYKALPTPQLWGCNFVDLFDLRNAHLATGVGGAGWSSPVPRHLGEQHWRELTIDDIETVHWRKRGGRPQPAAPLDERHLNFNLNGEWAQGTTSYRPIIDVGEARPSTHVEVDVAWKAVAVDSVRIERKHRRIWFDGKPAYERSAVVELEGPGATVFIESAMGRQATRLSYEPFFAPQAIRSPSF